MLKECDVFSDSYGCIITRSIGYQAPFPVVRLSNGWFAKTRSQTCVQGSCFVSSGGEKNISRGRLLTMDVSACASSVSLLQLLSSSSPPLTLEADVEYVSKIDSGESVSAVVTRGEGNQWSTSVYVQGDDSICAPRTRRANFRHTAAVSLLGSALWLVEAASKDSGVRAVHRCSLSTALEGGASESTLISSDLGRPLDIVALTEDVALVLGTKGVTLADRRQRSSDILLCSALLNGGATGDKQLLTFGEDYTLRAFDLRHISAPLFESSSASYLRIKSEVGNRASLLVASDITGIFDVLHLTTVASLQHSGDTVLDAVILPSQQSGVRVCTSTGSGMICDWTVA